MKKINTSGLKRLRFRDKLVVSGNINVRDISYSILDKIEALSSYMLAVKGTKEISHSKVTLKIKDDSNDLKFYELQDNMDWDMFEYEFFKTAVKFEENSLDERELKLALENIKKGLEEDLMLEEQLFISEEICIIIVVNMYYR